MSKKKTTREFILESIAAHGGRYDYTKTEYKTAKDKVTIVCKIHGEFLQNPGEHAKGANCPACMNESRAQQRSERMTGQTAYNKGIKTGKASAHRTTTEEFIRRAREVHGDRFDYSKTIYTARTANVVVICPVHGEFVQAAGNHLITKGCKLCSWKKQV